MITENLTLQKDFITPEHSISDFLAMGLLAVPVVENGKPIAYLTLSHVISDLIPKDVFMRADGIAKNPGNLELTEKNYYERYRDDPSISRHTIPLLATVEHDDPIIKAVCLMLEHRIPLIAVTKNGGYIGFINLQNVGSYLSSLIKKG